MAIKKFKVRTLVKYKHKNNKYSETFKVISEKEFLKNDLKYSQKSPSGKELVKQIKERSRKEYKCNPVFLVNTDSSEIYNSWMPEDQLIPWGKAAEVLYGKT